MYDDFCYQLINIRSFPFSTMMNQISVFIHVFMECIREDDVLQFWIMSHFPVLLKVYKMARLHEVADEWCLDYYTL